MNKNAPAHGKAIASLICSIAGFIFCFFGYSSIVSIILGIVGIVLSNKAKKEGNDEVLRKVGFVISIITVIAGIIGIIITVFFVGAFVAGGLDAVGSSM
ncbi:MAG: hypothetical protein ACOYBD_04325 [Bilifractor sp.]